MKSKIQKRDENLRAVVLGGYGYMGVAAVKDMVQSGVFEEVAVAGRRLEKAKKLAEGFKGQKTKVSAQFVDANKHDSLVKAMEEADVVASCIGPYHKYGVKVLKAAIDAKVNFVDIDDDFDATRECLKLNSEAKKAGVTAIIGLGESPGITNLLAKYGAEKLDRVDEIHVKWVTSLWDPSGLAALDHWFYITTGMVPQFINGKWVDVPARSEPEIVDFGPPTGKAEVFMCGHGEPVSLPRYIKGVKTVTNKGGLRGPSWYLEALNHLADLGFFSRETLYLRDLSLQPLDFTIRLLGALRHFAPEKTWEHLTQSMKTEESVEPSFKTDVIGEKNGELMQISYKVADSLTMASGTGNALSIGAQMLAKGKIRVKGVFAPEGCIDPKQFFAELKKRNIFIYETEERTRKISF